jgi:pimeloyl-[acyl-carrier protein] methyl ester esterase
MTNLLHLNVIGKGQPLVLLHGWGWHSGIWSSLIPHLADKFQLFIPDLPGFGKSPALTEHYTFAALAKRLFTAVPSEAIWLGWSLGGMLAWWIAVHHPEKINRLITVSASPKFISDEQWPGTSSVALKKFSTDLIDRYQETLYDFLELQLRGNHKNEIVFSELKKQLSPMHATALMGGLHLLNESDLRCKLSTIKIPSLHIFGNLDTLVPAKVIPHLQSLLSYGQCEIIKRAGHIPFLSHPDKFLKLFFAWTNNHT